MTPRPAVLVLLISFTFKSFWVYVCALPRKFTDEELLTSHLPYLRALRDKFNEGDVASLGSVYHEDASLLLRLGQEAQVSPSLKGSKLHDERLFRERAQITEFWSYLIHDIGFKAMRAYETEGEYAPTVFPVDDDTVVVSSPFTFGGAATGRFLSQTWIRVQDPVAADHSIWQVRSDLLSLDSIDSVLLTAERKEEHAGAAPTPSSAAATSQASISTSQPPHAESPVAAALNAEAHAEEKVAEGSQVAHATTPTPEQIVSTPVPTADSPKPSHTLGTTATPYHYVTSAAPLGTGYSQAPAYSSQDFTEGLNTPSPPSTEEYDDTDSGGDVSGEATPVLGARRSYGAGVVILWIVAILSGCFWFFYVYRAKRRREKTTIGGPDMLLG